MRVNWKVSAWNGVVFPERREPLWSASDDEAVKVWADGIMDRFGEYVRKMCEDSEISRQQHRSAERAARYDGWAWVRLEVQRKRDHVTTSVSLDNLNGVDGELRQSVEDFAASLAHIAVAMWHNLAEPKARAFIRLDESSPYIREGMRRHKWVKEHPGEDGSVDDYEREGGAE